MSFEEMVYWLEPQPETKDAKGNKIPARAGAVCRSDDDFTRYKIALEQACALLQDRCTPEMKATIANVTGNTTELLKRGQKEKEILGSGETFLRLQDEKTGPF